MDVSYTHTRQPTPNLSAQNPCVSLVYFPASLTFPQTTLDPGHEKSTRLCRSSPDWPNPGYETKTFYLFCATCCKHPPLLTASDSRLPQTMPRLLVQRTTEFHSAIPARLQRSIINLREQIRDAAATAKNIHAPLRRSQNTIEAPLNEMCRVSFVRHNCVCTRLDTRS